MPLFEPHCPLCSRFVLACTCRPGLPQRHEAALSKPDDASGDVQEGPGVGRGAGGWQRLQSNVESFSRSLQSTLQRHQQHSNDPVAREGHRGLHSCAPAGQQSGATNRGLQGPLEALLSWRESRQVATTILATDEAQERHQQRGNQRHITSPAEAAVAKAQAWLEGVRAEVLSLPDKAGRFADSVLRPLTHHEASSAEGTSYTHGGVVAEKSRLERLEQFARAARQQATVSSSGSPRLPAAHVASGGAGSGVSGSGGGLPGLGGFASLMQLGLPPLGPEAGLSAVASVGLDGDCPQEIRQAVTDEHLLQFGAALGEEAAMKASCELGLPAPWGQEPSLFGAEEGAAGGAPAGEEWEQIVDRSQPGLRYSAWRRPLRRGLYVYRSSAVIEGVSPGELRAFHLDDMGRSTWDDTVMEIQRVKPPSADHHPPHNSECSLHRFRCRFPMPMAPRVYNYARRVWHRPADGGCYAICRTTQLPGSVGRGGGGGGFGWPAREVEVGDYVSSVVIRATEGGAELATVYFEDSAVQPGLAKMAVPNGLWPFILKYEQGLRASVKGQQQQHVRPRLEELPQEQPAVQEQLTSGQQLVLTDEVPQGQRQGFQWPFQPQRPKLQQQQQQQEEPQLRQGLQTQGLLQPGAEPRQVNQGFQWPFQPPQQEQCHQQPQGQQQQQQREVPRPEQILAQRQPHGQPSSQQGHGFQWPFQQPEHRPQQLAQGVDALHPGQEQQQQPRGIQWPFQRPRQQAQRRPQHSLPQRSPQAGQEQQGQRHGFQWPHLQREEHPEQLQRSFGDQLGHGQHVDSREKRNRPFQEQHQQEQHEESTEAAAVQWPWQHRELRQQQEVEKQPEPGWPFQQQHERPAPQHGFDHPGQRQEPPWPLQQLQQPKQDEVQQQQLDAVARRPWWPVFGLIPQAKEDK